MKIEIFSTEQTENMDDVFLKQNNTTKNKFEIKKL